MRKICVNNKRLQQAKRILNSQFVKLHLKMQRYLKMANKICSNNGNSENKTLLN